MTAQQSIKKRVSVKGSGLHTGVPSTVTFCPAEVDSGYIFQRIDLEHKPLIRAIADNVSDTSRGTTISENGGSVHTIEHSLAALRGLGIDNALIQIDGPELPIMDGSSLPFVTALLEAGIQAQDAIRKVYVLKEQIYFEDKERGVKLLAIPAERYSLEVTIDYGSSILEAQEVELSDIKDFQSDFADARTFCFLHELEAMLDAGLIKGGDLGNALVLVDKEVDDVEMRRLCGLFNKPEMKICKGVLNNSPMRYEDEPARHKLLDVIGDLTLVGMPVQCKIIANRPGHKANIELAKKIRSLL